MELTKTKEMKSFYKRLDKIQSTKKNSFTLDFDNYSNRKLVLIYAKLFAFFLSCEKQYKTELEKAFFIRPVKSTTKKKGYHVKVYIQNTFFENIYLRAKFNDDRRRLTTDIKRFNMDLGSDFNEDKPVYDVAFKEKIIDSISYKKDFKIVNILKTVYMSRKTFYKLIKYLKCENRVGISLILNGMNQTKNLRLTEAEQKAIALAFEYFEDED